FGTTSSRRTKNTPSPSPKTIHKSSPNPEHSAGCRRRSLTERDQTVTSPRSFPVGVGLASATASNARQPEVRRPRANNVSGDGHEGPRLGQEDLRQIQDNPPQGRGPDHLRRQPPPQATARLRRQSQWPTSQASIFPARSRSRSRSRTSTESAT